MVQECDELTSKFVGKLINQVVNQLINQLMIHYIQQPVNWMINWFLINVNVHDIDNWIVRNKLKLNDDETQLIILISAAHRPQPAADIKESQLFNAH